jgi:hypothetical protein
MLGNGFENKLAGSDKTLDTLDASFGSNEVRAKDSSVLQMSKKTKSVSSSLERKYKFECALFVYAENWYITILLHDRARNNM